MESEPDLQQLNDAVTREEEKLREIGERHEAIEWQMAEDNVDDAEFQRRMAEIEYDRNCQQDLVDEAERNFKDALSFDDDDDSDGESLSVDDAADIWLSHGMDEDYTFGYSVEELRRAAESD